MKNHEEPLPTPVVNWFPLGTGLGNTGVLPDLGGRWYPEQHGRSWNSTSSQSRADRKKKYKQNGKQSSTHMKFWYLNYSSDHLPILEGPCAGTHFRPLAETHPFFPPNQLRASLRASLRCTESTSPRPHRRSCTAREGRGTSPVPGSDWSKRSNSLAASPEVPGDEAVWSLVRRGLCSKGMIENEKTHQLQYQSWL